MAGNGISGDIGRGTARNEIWPLAVCSLTGICRPRLAITMPPYARRHRSSNAEDDRLGNMTRRYFIDLTISFALVQFCPVMADWDIEQDESELPAYLSKENDGSINVMSSCVFGSTKAPSRAQRM